MVAATCPIGGEGSEACSSKIDIQGADVRRCNDVHRAGDWERRHGDATRQRLELNDTKGIGEAREHKDIGSCDVSRKRRAGKGAKKMRAWVARSQFLFLRPMPDHNF